MKISVEIEVPSASSEDTYAGDAIRVIIASLRHVPLSVPADEYRRIPVRDFSGMETGTLVIDNRGQ